MASEARPANLVHTTGPLLLGYVSNFILYGVFCVQTYIYYISFPKDRAASRIVVYSLLVIETVQVVLNTWDVFDIFAAGFGDFDNLDHIHMSWFAVPIMTGLVSFMVQCFYSYRIYLLTGGMVVPGIISLISLTQFTASVVGGIQVFIKGRFSQIESTRIASTIWLSGSAAADILIAVSMTFHLLRADSGFRSTHLLLTKLIRLIIETGTITAVVALIDLILFLAFPHATYHTVPAQSLSKLYSNAILVLFNSRVKIRGGREELYNPQASEVELGTLEGTLGFGFARGRSTTQAESQTLERHWTGDGASVRSKKARSTNGEDTISTRHENEATKRKPLPLLG